MVFLARGLLARGHDVHCYCNPETSHAELPGAIFHHVRPTVVSQSRIGLPLECGSFALAATRALRRDRPAYDVVDVCGTAAWEHDVVTVHGVTSALLANWWDNVGHDRRMRKLRRRAAPVLRPHIALTQTIEKLQFRPGAFKRVIVPTEQIKRDVVEVHGVAPELIDVNPNPVDIDVFASARRNHLRPQLGIPDDACLLLFVGDDFIHTDVVAAYQP